MTKRPHIRSFKTAMAFLGKKDYRSLCGNTTIRRTETPLANSIGLEMSCVVIRYYNTDILTYWADGRWSFCNSWPTTSTQKRLRDFGPLGFTFSIAGGEWSVWNYTKGSILKSLSPFARYRSNAPAAKVKWLARVCGVK